MKNDPQDPSKLSATSKSITQKSQEHQNDIFSLNFKHFANNSQAICLTKINFNI